MDVGIVGSSGFLANAVGSFCNQNNFDVTAIGRKRSDKYQSDQYYYSDLSLDNFPFKECLKSDLLFYTAGKGIQSGIPTSAEELFYTNTYFPILLSEKLKKEQYKGTLVTFGSYFEIGNNISIESFNENDIIRTTLEVPNDYCISKRLLTRYFSSASLPFKFVHFILPTIYGEQEQPNRLIPYLIKSLQAGHDIKLTSGQQVRQYIYVEDAIQIIFKSLSGSQPSGIYNFISAETLSVIEVAQTVFDFFGVEMKPQIFGSLERQDASMKVLQLDSNKFSQHVDPFELHKIVDIIPRYINNGFN